MYENEDYMRAYVPYQSSNLEKNLMMNGCGCCRSSNLSGVNTYSDMNSYMQPMNTMPGTQNLGPMNGIMPNMPNAQPMNIMPSMPNMQMMNAMPGMMNPIQNTHMTNENLERMYPESYRLIYPMVKKACDMMEGKDITELTLNEMTNRIYLNIEAENPDMDLKIENKREDSKETRMAPVRPRNRFLNDLIRVLLLRELFERGHRRPYPMFRSSNQSYSILRPCYNY